MKRHTLRMARARAAAKRDQPSGRRWPYFDPWSWVRVTIRNGPKVDMADLRPGAITWVEEYRRVPPMLERWFRRL